MKSEQWSVPNLDRRGFLCDNLRVGAGSLDLLHDSVLRLGLAPLRRIRNSEAPILTNLNIPSTDCHGPRSEYSAISPPVYKQQAHSTTCTYVPQHQQCTDPASYKNPFFPFDLLNNLGLFSLPSCPLLSGEKDAGIELSDFLFFKPRSSF